MTATGQPCSSANSRNAAQAAVRSATGPIGSGDTSAHALVHGVGDEGVAVEEPPLVVAEGEVGQRVAAVLGDEAPGPLGRLGLGRR